MSGHDTEDKGWWVIEWAKKEQDFVKKVCPQLGLSAHMNPAKDKDPYAHDIFVEGSISDLKCQQTPFFTAGTRYGIDPQFAVTFNHKDLVRYSSLYPNIVLYYWVNWITLQWQQLRVYPMAGVWRAELPVLAKLAESAPLHTYQRRVGDAAGNAKSSYVIDLRSLECLRVTRGDNVTKLDYRAR